MSVGVSSPRLCVSIDCDWPVMEIVCDVLSSELCNAEQCDANQQSDGRRLPCPPRPLPVPISVALGAARSQHPTLL